LRQRWSWTVPKNIHGNGLGGFQRPNSVRRGNMALALCICNR
jgi:hypothetical protein